jgi:hypothetical protein
VPRKTPYEAVEAYVQPLREAISCLSQTAHFATAGGHYVSDKPHVLTLVDGARLRLQSSDDTDLTLSVSQQYEIVEDESGFRVRTLKYAYKIDNWQDGHEVMAYHWHPAERIKYPHLHLSYGARVGREDLRKAHVPTGRIALEDVIQFLIESFRVMPAKEHWETVLDGSRAKFREHRSWS